MCIFFSHWYLHLLTLGFPLIFKWVSTSQNYQSLVNCHILNFIKIGYLIYPKFLSNMTILFLEHCNALIYSPNFLIHKLLHQDAADSIDVLSKSIPMQYCSLWSNILGEIGFFMHITLFFSSQTNFLKFYFYSWINICLEYKVYLS